MSSRILVLVVLAMFSATVIMADAPPNDPCVTWVEWNSNKPITDLSRWYTADYVPMIYDTYAGCDSCEGSGYVIPCFAQDTNTWGHHDYVPGQFATDTCRTWVNGVVHFANNFYLPSKGAAVKTWEWQLTQSGATVPANAIRFGKAVMARSTANRGGCCMGKGFTGWADGQTNGTFGQVHFAIASHPVTWTSFAVAICKAYHPTPAPTTKGPKPTNPPKPTLPPPTKPYIRFAHALPATHNLDAEIYQASSGRSYTWTNYPFAKFSNWVELFETGSGVITLWENKGGHRVQPALLSNHSIPLTPGPLIVAVKANIGLVNRSIWPPNQPTNVETIAASYVPINNQSESGVRLFNLSPDVASADLFSGTTMLAQGVKYTIGSTWVPIPLNSQTFTAKTNGGVTLAHTTTSPPTPPFVFTTFLLGLAQNGTGSLRPQLLPLIDAPEQV